MEDAVETENVELFMARIRVLFSSEEAERILLAYMVAKFAHRWQTRKELGPDGEPIRYFEHLRDATLILIDEVGCRHPLVVKSLLLHDSEEDTRLTRLFIETNFGAHVAHTVGLVSKNPKAGYLRRLRMHGTWEAYFVKGCDRLHNLRTLEAGSLAFRAKQLDETERDYDPLFDRMVEICPDEERDGARRLRRLIHDEVAEQRRLLALALAESRP